MSIRQFLLAAGLGCALLPALAQPAAADGSPISLAQVLRSARDNLDVALARHALAGARADIVAADRRPFPTLSAGIGNIDLQNGNGSGNPWTAQTYDKSVGLDWTWERGNKRELRTLAARRAASAAESDLDDMRLQQTLVAQAGFFDLLAAQERLREVREIERSASQLAGSAGRRLQAGDLSAQEAARTEIEAQRALSDVQQAELERQRAALLLWQAAGLTILPEQLQAQAEWPAPDGPPVADADLDALVEARADVRAAQARVTAAQAALDSAGAQKHADITWGASYDHYPGTSISLLALRMQMPLQVGYAYQGEIARAGAQLALAQDALEKTRRLARGDLQRLQQELRNSAQRALTYEREILPRARKVAAGAETAYGKGAIPLTDLLDARRTLRATLLDALAARTDYAKAAGAWQLRTQPQAAAPASN